MNHPQSELAIAVVAYVDARMKVREIVAQEKWFIHSAEVVADEMEKFDALKAVVEKMETE